MTTHNIFVYGTLREGGFRDITQSAKTRCEDGYVKRIPGVYLLKGTLYNMGPFPALKIGTSKIVRGEVYEINDSVLDLIDRIEGYSAKHPKESLYIRQEVEVDLMNGGPEAKSIKCFTFEINRGQENLKQCKIIESGDWMVHCKEHPEGY